MYNLYRWFKNSACQLLFTSVFMVLSGLTSAQLPDPETPPIHLDQARQLVERLANASENVYTYRNYHIDWEPEHCSARTDCSSFITLLLKHTYGWTTNEFERWMHSTYPDAALYHDAIVKKHRFKRVLHMSALHPGDLLAIKYTDHHLSSNGVADTGHIMLVVSTPHPELMRHPTQGKRAFFVAVIDASTSGHGPQDTRARPDGKFTGGIGQGEIRLYADKEDRIIGYTWSTLANSKYYSGPDRDLVAGRLTDLSTRPKL